MPRVLLQYVLLHGATEYVCDVVAWLCRLYEDDHIEHYLDASYAAWCVLRVTVITFVAGKGSSPVNHKFKISF